MLLDLFEEVSSVHKVGQVVQSVSLENQNRTQRVSFKPVFVEPVEALKIGCGNFALHFSPSNENARLQGFYRALKVDHEVGWPQCSGNGLVELPVRFPIALIDEALTEEIFGEDLSIFVDGAILNRSSSLAFQFSVQPKLMGQEEQLASKGPGLHVLIEFGQIGVVLMRLVEGPQSVLVAQKGREFRFARSDVSSNRDELLPWHKPTDLRAPASSVEPCLVTSPVRRRQRRRKPFRLIQPSSIEGSGTIFGRALRHRSLGIARDETCGETRFASLWRWSGQPSCFPSPY